MPLGKVRLRLERRKEGEVTLRRGGLASRQRGDRAAGELGVDPPTDGTLSGWWEQANTLEEE